MIKANDITRRSWIKYDENSDFPIQNIPFGVFKAKKLILYGGFEPIYLSSFRRMAYIPSISSFAFSTPGEISKGFIDLRVFAGFELDSFRFFARAENLAYLWTENSTEIIQNFPIPTVQIRLGITWDFWN